MAILCRYEYFRSTVDTVVIIPVRINMLDCRNLFEKSFTMFEGESCDLLVLDENSVSFLLLLISDV